MQPPDGQRTAVNPYQQEEANPYQEAISCLDKIITQSASLQKKVSDLSPKMFCVGYQLLTPLYAELNELNTTIESLLSCDIPFKGTINSLDAESYDRLMKIFEEQTGFFNRKPKRFEKFGQTSITSHINQQLLAIEKEAKEKLKEINPPKPETTPEPTPSRCLMM